MPDTQDTSPAFTGLILQQDPRWHYSFWYPKDWYKYELSDRRIGALCSPAPQDPTTFFSVEVIPLPASVQAEDLPVLCEGVDEGIASLPGLHLESRVESVAGGQIEIERLYSFDDRGSTRVRRVRFIYSGDRLYSLMSQGSSADDYAYWLPMLNYCHLSFRTGLFDPRAYGPDGN